MRIWKVLEIMKQSFFFSICKYCSLIILYRHSNVRGDIKGEYIVLSIIIAKKQTLHEDVFNWLTQTDMLTGFFIPIVKNLESHGILLFAIFLALEVLGKCQLALKVIEFNNKNYETESCVNCIFNKKTQIKVKDVWIIHGKVKECSCKGHGIMELCKNPVLSWVHEMVCSYQVSFPDRLFLFQSRLVLGLYRALLCKLPYVMYVVIKRKRKP